VLGKCLALGPLGPLGPLSLLSTIEELLGRESSGSGLENLKYGRRDPSRWPRDTLYLQNSALIPPTRGGHSAGIVRSRTKAREFGDNLSVLRHYEDVWGDWRISCNILDSGGETSQLLLLLLTGDKTICPQVMFSVLYMVFTWWWLAEAETCSEETCVTYTRKEFVANEAIVF
jgi:hypothetical protein